MHILEQLPGRPKVRARAYRLASWLLSCVMASLGACTPEPPAERARAAAAFAPRPSPPAVGESGIPPLPAHPMEEWTYADDFEELHAIWQARFALSAAADRDPDALAPYADAVMVDGASWGVQPDAIHFIYLDEHGRGLRLNGPVHPHMGDGHPRSAVDTGELDGLGWTKLQREGGIRVSYSGLNIHLIGAVHAEAACTACHNVPEHTLMGVLRYELTEIPDD